MPSSQDRHAIVIGAGISGLAATLALRRRGWRVTLLERDAAVGGTDGGDAFLTWDRRGVSQIRHSHAFLGRLRMVLRDRYPDLLTALLAAGVREYRLIEVPPLTLGVVPPEPGDDDLVVLGCRRTTFEWVVRQTVLADSTLTLVPGATVEALIAEPGDPPRVTGVRYRTSAGSVSLAADVVVDASGRRSACVDWLAAIGARAPEETHESSGIVYYTRYYRLRAGAAEPPRSEHPTAEDWNWVKYAVFPADDRTFSVTLATPLAFPAMKILAQPAAFDEMVRHIPGLAPWLVLGEPLVAQERGVQAMGGLVNRLRRFVDARGPLVLGFHVLGDAAYCTNPLYGRGCTQGFLHAELLGDALDAHPSHPAAVAKALDDGSRAQIEPFYRASVLADREALRKAEGRPHRRRASRWRERFFEHGILIGTRCDPVIFRAFVRMMNMIETPEQAFGRPAVVWRAVRVMARGRRRNARYYPQQPPEFTATLARLESATTAAA